MSGEEEQDRRQELAAVVDAAQRAAGVLAARHRGDASGAQDLMTSFEDDRTLASGALLLAELSVGLYSRESGEDVEACLGELAVSMEQALARG